MALLFTHSTNVYSIWAISLDASINLIGILIFISCRHSLLVYHGIDIIELKRSLREAVLDFIDSIVYAVINKSQCMIFLTIQNCGASHVYSEFLLIHSKEVIMVISMAEAEEDSCDGTSLGKGAKGIVLHELFEISVLLNIRIVVVWETSANAWIDERWFVQRLNTLVFVFFKRIFIYLASHRSQVNLEEEVVHVRFQTVRICYIGATFIDQSFLRGWDHISHVDAYFVILERAFWTVNCVFVTVNRDEWNSWLVDLKLTFDFAILRAIVHDEGFDHFFICLILEFVMVEVL